MAIEHALNEFQSEVFMVKPEYNLLVQNFEGILARTQLKHNEEQHDSFLGSLCRDMVHFYATFFSEGDRKKAKTELE